MKKMRTKGMVASTVANTMDEREDVPLTPQELKPLIDCDIIVYRCGFAADAQVRRELQQQDPSAPKGPRVVLLLRWLRHVARRSRPPRGAQVHHHQKRTGAFIVRSDDRTRPGKGQEGCSEGDQ